MKGVVMLLFFGVALAVATATLMVPLTSSRKVHLRFSGEPNRWHELWSEWKQTHGKQYGSSEELYRREIFFDNLRTVLVHNAKYPMSASYSMGLNKFSDMTLDEYKTYNRLLPVGNIISECQPAPQDWSKIDEKKLPKTVDWRTKGYVTRVKDQGKCGSCWAFSATGSVEGQYFNKTGHLLSLSEQQLVDCSRPEKNYGCEGGGMSMAYSYIMSQPRGLETEQDYPYTAKDGMCKTNVSKEKVQISTCMHVPWFSESYLKISTALVGPIAVAIDASHDSFRFYKGGVYTEPDCSSLILDHGVLVVGYGTYQGKDYWLVKNSWGADWGLNGYIMMARNQGNMCGIASLAMFPLA